MLEVAKIGADDYVIDLGSGDGRMVITAANALRRARLRGGSGPPAGGAGEPQCRRRPASRDRAVFYERDLFLTDVSAASVLTIYLLPDVNLAIRSRLLATLRPGTRIVSHDYDFGEWPPDLQLEMAAPGKTVGVGQKSKVFYWVVPGIAAGKWRWQLQRDGRPEDYELALDQNFQKLQGTLAVGGRPAKLENAVLTGEQFSFSAVLEAAGSVAIFPGASSTTRSPGPRAGAKNRAGRRRSSPGTRRARRSGTRATSSRHRSRAK